MNTLNKIEEFINRIDERKKKDDYKPSKYLNGKKKVGGKDYDDFFKNMLKKWKIKSYKDLPKNKQDDFFNAVDKGWNAKKETD